MLTNRTYNARVIGELRIWLLPIAEIAIATVGKRNAGNNGRANVARFGAWGTERIGRRPLVHS